SLLATAVVLNLGGVLPDAQAKKARADISTIDMALELYRLDMYDYPDESYGLRALTEVPAGAPNEQNYSKDGYIKGGLPNDPWGRPYVYRYPGEYGVYDIMSYGADGAPGGEGRDADITNWNK
ncbi:MAG: type II secretion system major pseudopilin GspG, partial [Hyphomonadaceae bacterium]|nr:type II secretion system major pseudopilin GspG [Hyphomonadaceae bacterium]